MSDAFWLLDHLSNQQLLDSLGQVLRRQRRSLAELVAHLAEVEERRLHLEAAHCSLFDYCVRQLHMSEDEACRRIELARLTRRFPALFPLLASGDITLSAALVLKPVLTSDNHAELLEAARRKSIRETREMVAARFPSPDVPSTIRKLPEPNTVRASAPAPHSTPVAPLFAAPTPATAPCTTPRTDPPASSAPTDPPGAVAPPSVAPPSAHRIEPIATERYKLQLTIDASLKRQLETARDLLRHANPSGDFASILSRALDLLVAELLRHRFGVGARRKANRDRKLTPANTPASASPPSNSPSSPATHIAHATRRAVLERDGLACTWVDASGNRCSSRAWLELDHRQPHGKGGGSDAENIRLLCRAHNQLAAEQAYGRAHIERAKATRRPFRRNTPSGRTAATDGHAVFSRAGGEHVGDSS